MNVIFVVFVAVHSDARTTQAACMCLHAALNTTNAPGQMHVHQSKASTQSHHQLANMPYIPSRVNWSVTKHGAFITSDTNGFKIAHCAFAFRLLPAEGLTHVAMADVAKLNALAAAAPVAEGSALFAALLHCCGSQKWVAELARRLPVGDLDALLRAADEADAALGREDWLEAFAAHPRVGLHEKFLFYLTGF